MTQDEELDALVKRLKEMERSLSFQSRNVKDARTCRLSADAITTLRAQLAEARVKNEKLGREVNMARYGMPDFAWSIHKEALAEATARAEQAEAEAAALRDEVARLRGLTGYVLQDDLCNRLTPRVVDIAYSAFMIGRVGKNEDDGGPCDWFNDTRPMVMTQIAKISAALTAEPLGHGVTADDFGGEA